MGRSSSPEHFRNSYLHQRDWRLPLLREMMDDAGIQYRMTFLRQSGLPLVAAALLLAASVSLAQTEEHPKPIHHTAQKAPHHQAPKAEHHAAPKAPHHKAHAAAHHAGPKVKKHPRGQQAIDRERATQIQEALVREHYMSGSPSGAWDNATQEAMRRYQSDHGWQSKTVPDSRALIRLGLGPDHEHLLNPETAMTSEPQLPHGTGSGHSFSSASARASTQGSAASSTVPASANSNSTIASPQSSIPAAPADLTTAH
jgi:putative peptidoglycan binding protein